MTYVVRTLIGFAALIVPTIALATIPVGVPEIDGAGLVVAFAILVSVLALIKERFSK